MITWFWQVASQLFVYKEIRSGSLEYRSSLHKKRLCITFRVLIRCGANPAKLVSMSFPCDIEESMFSFKEMKATPFFSSSSTIDRMSLVYKVWFHDKGVLISYVIKHSLKLRSLATALTADEILFSTLIMTLPVWAWRFLITGRLQMRFAEFSFLLPFRLLTFSCRKVSVISLDI